MVSDLLLLVGLPLLISTAVASKPEVQSKHAKLAAFVQPTIILVMAGAVGVVAFSMITGIFQAVSGLRTR